MKNLLSFIYLSPLGDSSNNGLSSKSETLTLYQGEPDIEFLKSLEQDQLILIERTSFGKRSDYAVPVSIYLSGKHSMFGGNFAYSNHSAFPTGSPIKIHDRVEN
jgi:hypothetical protein